MAREFIRCLSSILRWLEGRGRLMSLTANGRHYRADEHILLIGCLMDLSMSEELPFQSGEFARLLTSNEKLIVSHLLGGSTPVGLAEGWLDSATVIPMDDGGMGSLRFASTDSPRGITETSGEYSFQDDDGVEVLVSLNLNEDGLPFELDVWKTDFQPLSGELKLPR